MKEWLYNVPNSGTDNAPVGKSFCTMAYNADGTRYVLFSFFLSFLKQKKLTILDLKLPQMDLGR